MNHCENLDLRFMNLALEQARLALSVDEIPVGAVLVKDNAVVARAHNLTRTGGNPTAHAEKLVLDQLLKAGEKYFYDYTLYVTLEPCPMCAGYMLWCRVGRLVYGAADPKAGACGSIYHMPRDRRLNHHPQVTTGVEATACADLLREFFARKRA